MITVFAQKTQFCSLQHYAVISISTTFTAGDWERHCVLCSYMGFNALDRVGQHDKNAVYNGNVHKDICLITVLTYFCIKHFANKTLI